jgi:RNA polymerase sigma factor (sigma-70 family)
VILEEAELEALRLVDVEGLSQEEVGKKMGVSRGTIWRLLQEARRKTASALSEGRRIDIRSAE